LEPALLSFRPYVADRISHALIGVLPHDGIEVDHVILLDHLLPPQLAAHRGCRVSDLGPDSGFAINLLNIQSLRPGLICRQCNWRQDEPLFDRALVLGPSDPLALLLSGAFPA